jgi:hypothetical protein
MLMVMLKEFTLVQDCVDQVGIVAQIVAKTGVDYFEHRANSLLQCCDVPMLNE